MAEYPKQTVRGTISSLLAVISRSAKAVETIAEAVEITSRAGCNVARAQEQRSEQYLELNKLEMEKDRKLKIQEIEKLFAEVN